jgi:hypothetical protein
MAMHHHHRHPIEDEDNDHPAEALLPSADHPSDSTTSIGSSSPSCYPAQSVAILNLEDIVPPIILSNGGDTNSPVLSTHSLVATDEPHSEGSSASNDASSRSDPAPTPVVTDTPASRRQMGAQNISRRIHWGAQRGHILAHCWLAQAHIHWWRQ